MGNGIDDALFDDAIDTKGEFFIALIKKSNKTLKTTISLLDSSKAPKAAVGSKWVAVSYRIDSFKAKP